MDSRDGQGSRHDRALRRKAKSPGRHLLRAVLLRLRRARQPRVQDLHQCRQRRGRPQEILGRKLRRPRNRHLRGAAQQLRARLHHGIFPHPARRAGDLSRQIDLCALRHHRQRDGARARMGRPRHHRDFQHHAPAGAHLRRRGHLPVPVLQERPCVRSVLCRPRRQIPEAARRDLAQALAMDKIRIRGGRPLHGVIPIGGAKNAALPLMAPSLLTDEPLVLKNLPLLADITTLSHLLVQHGVTITMLGAKSADERGHVLELKARRIVSTTAPYDLVRKMRATVLVLGPLVARAERARVSLPGGCAIGTRPVDLHLKALERLGATGELDKGYIEARAEKGLTGAEIVFPIVSVGATENTLMAASLAEGETVLVNAAREPEIADLAACLTPMGAHITGAGTDRIRIEGVKRLHGATHSVIPDRIETGTYMMAAAITGGSLDLLGANHDMVASVARVREGAGREVAQIPNGIRVSRRANRLNGVDVTTEPFPGFPTDLQAQLMALMSTADGAAMITETIFENRFMHVPELTRMGADIAVHGAAAMVRGVEKLTGAPVMATDLRASVSLVLAGLAAEGETMVNRVYHLDRGFERLEEKLSGVGAEIERQSV